MSPLRVLVDTSVLLDLTLSREPWFTEARPLWDARDAGMSSAIFLPPS